MHAEILLVKLVITPALIAIATLVARRWGPGVAGWLAGFPLTSGPVSVFLALEQGPAFAADAAVGTLFGLAAMAICCLTYARIAHAASWPVSTGTGLLAFLICGAALRRVPPSLPLAFALVCVVLALSAIAMPATALPGRGLSPRGWDLPLRMAVGTAVVLLLTGAASWLGPALSGLLSPVPVFLLVLAAFAHRTEGAEVSIRILLGGIVGSFAFAVFFLVVGAALDRLGIVATYTLASGSTMVVNSAVLVASRRVLALS
ncbi:MAG: hypothetical protein DME12_17380 [Candidatus Rokuibacteriota bacterium]|nr:MAG: hypothetical protein DMD80_27500 [Candidatus Rokubacteria bacterium]PYM39967.1 MAG: hypothetical protein DME12_17380 [Candidatus Rokubacteria bacterium]PYM63317.1 MAG: hypothetical protein DME11_17220 [Candidatus Rokubacteria bacterium]